MLFIQVGNGRISSVKLAPPLPYMAYFMKFLPFSSENLMAPKYGPSRNITPNGSFWNTMLSTQASMSSILPHSRLWL